MERIGRSVLAGLCVIALLAVPRLALAHGIGAGGTVGFGTLKVETGSWFFGQPGRMDEDRYSIGMVYDTNVRQDRIFNYRLGVSYQNLHAWAANRKLTLEGISVENDFGFGLVREPAVRFWIGPELRLEYVEGVETVGASRNDHGVLSLGLGPAGGLNFNLAGGLSFLIKGGYMFQSGTSIFTTWGERYGFVGLALVTRFGGEGPPGRDTVQ